MTTADAAQTDVELVRKESDHKKVIFNDDDAEYKAPIVEPAAVANFDELSDDEDTPFGTTVDDSAYMAQYKRHNQQNTLLSPVAFNRDARPRATSHSDDPDQAQAMEQAAKFYNDLYDGKQGQTPRHAAQVSTSMHHNSSVEEVADQFEDRVLEYGQPVKFHKTTDQYFATKGEKRHVLVNLHVSRITEIDTVRERFRCRFAISFSWLPTFTEWREYCQFKRDGTLIAWRPAWIPVIAFPERIIEWKSVFAEKPNEGAFSISRLQGKEEEIGYDPSYCLFIRCKLECDMTLSTGFWLVNFPVDCQDLPISIHETSGGCLFVVEKRKRCFASVHTISSVMEEWEFKNMIIEVGQLIAGNDHSTTAQMKMRLKMQRRWQVYGWNVVFFMSLISGLTLCSFAVDDTDLGERLSIIITLLLTSVAYQSTVFDTLPNVPYLTLLDKYIVSSFIFMTLVTIITSLFGTQAFQELEDENSSLNAIAFMITAMIFVGYHVSFILLAVIRKNFESKKLNMSSKKMLELYSQSRERMEVEWNSETLAGSSWKIYTKHPEKLITTSSSGKDMYGRSQSFIQKNKSKVVVF